MSTGSTTDNATLPGMDEATEVPANDAGSDTAGATTGTLPGIDAGPEKPRKAKKVRPKPVKFTHGECVMLAPVEITEPEYTSIRTDIEMAFATAGLSDPGCPHRLERVRKFLDCLRPCEGSIPQ